MRSHRLVAAHLLLVATMACGEQPQPLGATSSPSSLNGNGAGAGIGERAETFVDTERDREIRTTIWYPKNGDDIADGRHPLVLLSHGLGAEPAGYENLIESWVRAGFVVAGPAYPMTNAAVIGSLQASDLVNQPADASFVLDELTEIATDTDDDLGRALDMERIAAVGHSLGGMTTVGLMSRCCEESRIDVAVVYAGSDRGFERDRLVDEPPPVLFVHGDDDSTVGIDGARDVYEQIEGSKAFVTLLGGGHTQPFFDASDRYFEIVRDTTLGFLRWQILDDERGLETFRDAAQNPQLAELEDDLDAQ